MNTEKPTKANHMLDAMLILKKNGYNCRATGMNFQITDPFGRKYFENITGLTDLARKLTQSIL